MASVLIVETESAIRHLLDDFFTSEGFHTLLASNGVSAVALASAAQPDVILLDIALAGGDGITATWVLREQADTRHIPIIAMSANTQFLSQMVAHVPVDQAIAKPFDLDELLDVVSAQLLGTPRAA
jgi:DNA-binding response OmpR family regulator